MNPLAEHGFARAAEAYALAARYKPQVALVDLFIGEESGALNQMLSKVAEFYEGEVDATLQSLAAAIEPVMIVLLGFCVGFIVIAMFMPL